ncbi:hypothetical protein [Enterococcus aquimarinus]|uniref:Uncharacterized protein n=1 Tax=Enterococcus aquimarinus TaxID=328396 RepID=A0A1L8QQT5_9ENTE|nr:hypothetical protein [Enterococcus aquimarinus]OJG09850.1 hypothetical protein RU93_GL000489 [Enterococcus aquimarinus]
MEEIDDHFYEHVPQDELAMSKIDVAHPFDVNWTLYDSLQPVSHSKSEGEA